MAKKVVRKTATKTSSSRSSVMSASASQKQTSQRSSRKYISKRNVIVAIVVVLILLGALLYFFRGLFIAATVNGQPITRLTLVSELEKKSGKQTLDVLVTRSIILQGMEKEGISVTDEEVQKEIKKIEDQLKKQGRTLDEALLQLQPPLTRSDLFDQVKIQKMIEKLFGKNATVTDKEVNAYIETNPDEFPEGQDPATLKTTVKDKLKQQKLGAKFEAWLSNLQKKANIQHYVNF